MEVDRVEINGCRVVVGWVGRQARMPSFAFTHRSSYDLTLYVRHVSSTF